LRNAGNCGAGSSALRGARRFPKNTGMSIPKSAASEQAKFDEDLTYSALANRARRKLLVALASGGPKSGDDLRQIGKGRAKYKGGTSHQPRLEERHGIDVTNRVARWLRPRGYHNRDGDGMRCGNEVREPVEVICCRSCCPRLCEPILM
jgi:hypothetical protein